MATALGLSVSEALSSPAVAGWGNTKAISPNQATQCSIIMGTLRKRSVMGLGVLTVGSVYLEKRSKRMLADEFSRLLNPTLYVSFLRQIAEYFPDFQR